MSLVSAAPRGARTLGPARREDGRGGWVVRGLMAALGLPLLVFASTGVFSRYVADDFCWAGVLRTEGFVRAQVSWYTAYSPRYAFTFLVNLVELAGPAIVPALPAAAILVSVASVAWSLSRLGVQQRAALVMGLVAAFSTLQTAPDMGQALYWQTGMLTYLLPLLLATLLIGWIARARLSPWAVAVSGLATFIAGGLAETYLIPQNVAITLTALVVLASVTVAPGLLPGSVEQRQRVLVHVVAALIGGVLALATILLAPSTASRVGGSPADLWLAAAAAIATAWYQVLRLLRYFGPTLILCVGLPGVLAATTGWRVPRLSRRSVGVVTLLATVTLPFCYFPSFYAQNGNPPARSLIVPGAILIGYAVFAGFACARHVEARLRRGPRVSPVVAAALLALVPVVAAAVSLPERAAAADYAALFDATDAQIRAGRDAGEPDIRIGPLPRHLGERFVNSDPKDWFNVCVARYYGVRSIAATADGP